MQSLITVLLDDPVVRPIAIVVAVIAALSFATRKLGLPALPNLIHKAWRFLMSQSYNVGPSDTRTKKMSFWMLAAVQCMLAAYCMVAVFAVGISWGFVLHGRGDDLAAVLVPGIFTLVMTLICIYHIRQAHAIRSAIFGVSLDDRHRLS